MFCYWGLDYSRCLNRFKKQNLKDVTTQSISNSFLPLSNGIFVESAHEIHFANTKCYYI